MWRGGPQFTHWAGYQAGLVVRSILFRFGGKVRREILPWVTFTEPELAHVGLTEEEARRRHGKISRCCAGRSRRTIAPQPSARRAAW